MSRRTIAERAWYDVQAFDRDPVGRIEQALSEAVGEHSCAEVVRHAVDLAIKQERKALREWAEANDFCETEGSRYVLLSEMFAMLDTRKS